VARLVIGVWSIFVPVLAATSGGFKGMAAILAGLLFISGAVGLLFMPNTAGKSLEEIQGERILGLACGASSV
jgi:inositol transporter-like SP family MFS transporter